MRIPLPTLTGFDGLAKNPLRWFLTRVVHYAIAAATVGIILIMASTLYALFGGRPLGQHIDQNQNESDSRQLEHHNNPIDHKNTAPQKRNINNDIDQEALIGDLISYYNARVNLTSLGKRSEDDASGRTLTQVSLTPERNLIGMYSGIPIYLEDIFDADIYDVNGLYIGTPVDIIYSIGGYRALLARTNDPERKLVLLRWSSIKWKIDQNTGKLSGAVDLSKVVE